MEASNTELVTAAPPPCRPLGKPVLRIPPTLALIARPHLALMVNVERAGPVQFVNLTDVSSLPWRSGLSPFEESLHALHIMQGQILRDGASAAADGLASNPQLEIFYERVITALTHNIQCRYGQQVVVDCDRASGMMGSCRTARPRAVRDTPPWV